jgi:hypothetical protein
MSTLPYVVEVTGKPTHYAATVADAVAWCAAFTPVHGGAYVQSNGKPVLGVYRESARTVWTLLGIPELWDAWAMLPAGNTLTPDSIRPAQPMEATA